MVAIDEADAAAPTADRVPRGPLAAFVAVFLMFLAGLPFSVAGRESYPAVAMPPFAGVPDTGRAVVATEPRLRVRYSDGSGREVEPVELLPYNWIGSAFATNVIFRTPQPTRDPETAAWLRDQVVDLVGGSPVALDVTWVVVEFDRETREKRDVRTRIAYSVDLDQ